MPPSGLRANPSLRLEVVLFGSLRKPMHYGIPKQEVSVIENPLGALTVVTLGNSREIFAGSTKLDRLLIYFAVSCRPLLL